MEEETERVVETGKEGEDETESVKVMPSPLYMNSEYEIERMFFE